MKKAIQFLAFAMLSVFVLGFKTNHPVSAKADCFLKIEGIKGIAKDADFKEWLPVKKIAVSKNAVRFFREPDRSSNKIAGFYMGPVQAKPAVFVAKGKGVSAGQVLKVSLQNWKMSDFMAQSLDEEIELKYEKLEATVTVNGEEKPVAAADLKAFFEQNFQ